MSDQRRQNGGLFNALEDLAVGVGRLSYGLLSLPLGLLPRETRSHMQQAVRELSYGFASLPRDFADVAGVEIERWAAEGSAVAPVADPPKVHRASPPPPSAADLSEMTPAPASVALLDLGDLVAEPPASAIPDLSELVAEPPPSAIPDLSELVLEPPPSAIPDLAELVPEPTLTSLEDSLRATGTDGVTIAYIEYDPPGRDIDGEYVRLRNTSGSVVDMTGWRLSDGEGNHVFVFPVFALAPGAEVRVWSKAGANDAANLYWGNRTALWNNSGDTGTLTDADGNVLSTYSY